MGVPVPDTVLDPSAPSSSPCRPDDGGSHHGLLRPGRADNTPGKARRTRCGVLPAVHRETVAADALSIAGTGAIASGRSTSTAGFWRDSRRAGRSATREIPESRIGGIDDRITMRDSVAKPDKTDSTPPAGFVHPGVFPMRSRWLFGNATTNVIEYHRKSPSVQLLRSPASPSSPSKSAQRAPALKHHRSEADQRQSSALHGASELTAGHEQRPNRS